MIGISRVTRRTWAPAAVAYLVLATGIRDASADAPSGPAAALTIGDVVEGLKAAEARIHNLSCTSDFVSKGYFRDAAGNPPRPGLVEHDAVEARQISAGSWIVESSGKSWCKY